MAMGRPQWEEVVRIRTQVQGKPLSAFLDEEAVNYHEKRRTSYAAPRNPQC